MGANACSIKLLFKDFAYGRFCRESSEELRTPGACC